MLMMPAGLIGWKQGERKSPGGTTGNTSMSSIVLLADGFSSTSMS
jgi:hypothetical protein